MKWPGEPISLCLNSSYCIMMGFYCTSGSSRAFLHLRLCVYYSLPSLSFSRLAPACPSKLLAGTTFFKWLPPAHITFCHQIVWGVQISFFNGIPSARSYHHSKHRANYNCSDTCLSLFFYLPGPLITQHTHTNTRACTHTCTELVCPFGVRILFFTSIFALNIQPRGRHKE